MNDVTAEHLYTAGFGLYNAGNMDEAESTFSALCVRDKSDPRFRFALAATRQALKCYADAADAWETAIQVAEARSFPTAVMHFHKAECHLSMQQMEDAKKELQEAKTLAQDDTLLLQRVEVLAERNGL